jgi:hypothetical protein
MISQRGPGRVRRRLMHGVLALGLLPGLAAGRCLPFKLPEQIGKVPFVVHGTVSRSNQASLNADLCRDQACTHQFSVDVVEALKGRVTRRSLHVQYPYAPQREEIALFSEGQAFIFAISRIGPDGLATLYGTSCGRAGLPVQALDDVRRALTKPSARPASR